jgi:subtilisin family serine protease
MTPAQRFRRAARGGALALVLSFIALLAPAPFAETRAAAAPGAGCTDAGAPVSETCSPIIPGRYIVRLQADADVDATLARARQGHGIRADRVYRSAIRGFAANMDDATAAALRADPAVVSVEPDRVLTLLDEQWPTGVDRIDAEPPGAPNDAGAAVDIDVAVIDTGVSLTHPDLNVVGGFAMYGEPLSFLLICGITQTYDDKHGHGTHVAGIIGARDDDAGVVGVAPGARIWAVRVLGPEGAGCLSDIVAGIDWVTANADTIEVANMSLGGGDLPLLCQAIAQSAMAGVVYTVSAGNSGMDARTFSPANCPDVIAVSAIADYDGQPGGLASPTCKDWGPDDTLATFSNFGPVVDVAAPGVCIYSTLPNASYGVNSGTSMAAPHVAGAVARYLTSHTYDGSASGPSILRAMLEAGMGVAQASACGFSGDHDGFVEPLIYVGTTCDPAPLDPLPEPAPTVEPTPVLPASMVLHPDTQLSDSPPSADAGFGESIAEGDIDGDGEQDLVVVSSGGGDSSVAVFYGAGASQSNILETQDTGGGLSGQLVVAGDVNGDGLEDVIVADPGAADGAGNVTVYFGPDLTSSVVLTSPSPAPGAAFGAAVTAGDTNGDGIGDVIVGEPGASAGAVAGAGRVHIFPGPALDSVVSVASPYPQQGAAFGSAVATGDTEGTGQAGLIVGAPAQNGFTDPDAGAIFVFQSVQPLAASLLIETGAGSRLGGSLRAGDIDGDGVAEIVAGADGGVVVFDRFGSTWSPRAILESGFGGSIAVHDGNGDGFADVLLGSPNHAVGDAAGAGRARLLMGPDLELSYYLQAVTPVAGARLGTQVTFSNFRSGGGVSVFASAPGIAVDQVQDAGAVFAHRIDDEDADRWFQAFDNCVTVANPDQRNSDAGPIPNGPNLTDDATVPNSDTLGDACDDDDDNDGIPDIIELQYPMPGCPASAPTNPLLMDSDGDGLSDGWECAVGSDPSNFWSRKYGSGGTDADGDHIPDLWELRGYNTSPSSLDTDGDGCTDMVEIASVDGTRDVSVADRLAVARALAFWEPDPAQTAALDLNKNGVLDPGDHLFVARAALLPSWQPKVCA